MKLFLLKIILQRRTRDEGFTLPMVIALGLVMVLLGTVNIVKSNEENLNAISLNSSSDALAVAEVGVTKYRELLNQNRILTVYNHDQWTTNANVTGQTCDNIATTPTGWEDGGTAAAPNDTTKWWEINENIDGTAGDETIGEYKLVSYVYDNDGNRADNDNGQFVPNDDLANTTDSFTYNDTAYDPVTSPNGYNPRGILTIQGRSRDDSEAQIEVEIPLRINDLENFAPVLWVGSGAINNSGTLNIVDSEQNIVFSGAGSNCAKPADIDGNNVIRDPRSIPSIIDDPAGVSTATPPIPAIPNTNKNGSNNGIGSISTVGGEVLLPRPQSPPDNKTSSDDQGRFLYDISTLTINDNDLLTDGTAKVTLYVRNNITISNTGGTVNLGNFNKATSNVSSHNLEIYGNTSTQITIDSGSSGDETNIEAFIHAPNSTMNIAGNGRVNINGAVWVNNFNITGSAEVNIEGDQTDTTTGSEPSYKFYTTIANRTPRPITSSPTNWEREEVE
ncbi:hypothetical protein [Pleurocapsa sp. PCC 7319]|uniref:DUF7305 domain-containing protein n=1 Tax=Pleurocapsa sp. PCC 7319 TaxID=118161 RepID=UPI000346F077|nr:hypothetical protein [Pleurocapsa sp. PCC 7319]